MNLGPSGKQYHNVGNPIAKLGDGVKCFVGLVAATRSLPHKIMLVDEPEAFLHPPLARTLGRELTSAAQDNEASLVVATHSSEFLVGCVEASLETTVVRLTYEGDKATARQLQSETVKEMFTNPLLRSTDVLDALFHRVAVVTEANTDRVFYGEMNRRLQEDSRGMAEALFLNATGKGTIHQIIAPLRRIGIPAAAIVDLDLIEQSSHGTWNQMLDACQVPQAVRESLEDQRKQVADAFEKLTRADVASAAFVVKANRYAELKGDQKQRADELLAELKTLGSTRHSGSRAIKIQGISALTPQDKSVAEAFLKELRKYGLFLVPVGEIERWLGHLGIGGHGTNWLTALLSRIGNTSTDTNYLPAGKDDVWQFLEQIAQWTGNPDREGTRLT